MTSKRHPHATKNLQRQYERSWLTVSNKNIGAKCTKNGCHERETLKDWEDERTSSAYDARAGTQTGVEPGIGTGTEKRCVADMTESLSDEHALNCRPGGQPWAQGAGRSGCLRGKFSNAHKI